MTLSVAVTGATGFIGRNLTSTLVEEGAVVRAVVRPESTRNVPGGVSVVRAPLESSALREAFEGVDAVVHLAGVVNTLDEMEYTAVNVDGTKAVARAAADAGVRVVHISSLAAAGPASFSAPRSENDVPCPCTPYGRSKLEGERVVTATQGLRWTILRPGVVYGPGDRALLPLFKCARVGLLPLVGRRDAAYMFVHVDDVVRTIGAALASPGGGDTVFVAHPQPVTGRDVLDAVGHAVGRRALVVSVPQPVTRVVAAACDLVAHSLGSPLPLGHWRYAELAAEGFVCRVDRLRERFGVIAALDLRQGMVRTADWYRKEGWLRR